jgi:hypothetical protein
MLIKAEESYRMLLSAKLIERMISQNAFEEIMNGETFILIGPLIEAVVYLFFVINVRLSIL